MTHHSTDSSHFHGPDNAEHEIRKAYNCVVETGVTHFWDRRAIPGVNADEVVTLYKQSFHFYRKGKRLAADAGHEQPNICPERFGMKLRSPFWSQEPAELPFLEGARDDEYGLHERSDTTTDLLDSVACHIPPGLDEMPENMKRYLARARRTLKIIGIARLQT